MRPLQGSATRRELLRLFGAGALGARFCALAAAGSRAPPGPLVHNPVDAGFARRFDELFFEQYWRRNTDQAVAAGYYRVAGILNVPNARYRADYLRFLEYWLTQLRPEPWAGLSERGRANWTVLDSQLRYERWALTTLREWQWNPALYNVADAVALILSTDYAPLEQRLRSVLRRLRAVPAYYAAALQALRQPTGEHRALAIEQNRGALDVFGDELKRQLADSSLEFRERASAAERIGAARAAIESYVAALEGLDSRGERTFRIGKALYEQKFQYMQQSGESAQSLFDRALHEQQQVLARMDELAGRLWAQYLPGAPVPADRHERIAGMIAKVSENHVTPADYLPAVARLIPQLVQWVQTHGLVELDPSKPLEVRATPAYERGVASAGIEAPGPYDPAARTYFNVDPLDERTAEQAESFLREYNNWMLPVFIIHEAIPGHYVQLMYANRSPSRIMSVFGNGAMIEGWAVYSERMMLESGYGGDAPEQWLMYWKWYLRSVSNVILDYSVHVLGISEASAKDLLRREAFQSEQEVAGKWQRVQRTSVQLTQYYAGFSAIYALRERLKQQLGAGFDLKAFHQRFLSFGSAPVQLIAALMSPAAPG
jgi:uncharacterized protein (DUF885 family)